MLDNVIKKFNESVGGMELPDELPVIVSGGTSKAHGFIDFFKTIISEYNNIPFKIKDIVGASDPLTAVAEGLLIKALADKEKEK